MIVFLDIDGPIANNRSGMAGFSYDPTTVVLVNEFLSQPGVEVVLSSTVRCLKDSAEEMAAHLFSKYALQGFKFHKRWRTGRNYGAGDGNRQREIEEWIVKFGKPDDVYVVIDDDAVNIENVVQIKADYNGLPFIELLRMRSLYNPDVVEELHSWEQWATKHV